MPLRLLDPTQSDPGALWSSNTASLIERGAVLPIISNYLLPTIFSGDPAEVPESWAKAIHSPLSRRDNRDLARVAQYYAVRERSVWKARVDYHNILKDFLLAQVRDDPDVDRDYVGALIASPGRRYAESFSEIARNVGYPRWPDPERNPMRLLAELPLPIYITTSQHCFLEQALVQTRKKTPETEIFYWDDALTGIQSVYERDPDYCPSIERPLVYHVFGVDTSPGSLVVSEDDFVSVLMRLCELKWEVKVSDSGNALGKVKRDIPSDIKQALSGAGLLLLGYNINNWDFRVLFRWLVKYIGGSRDGRSAPDAFCMQLRPNESRNAVDKDQAVQEYLTQFFEQKQFSVYWGDIESCVIELWSRWNQH